VRQRVLFVILGLTIVWSLSMWLAARSRAPIVPPPTRRQRHAAEAQPPAAEGSPQAGVGRDLFEYGGEPAGARHTGPAPRPVASATASPTTPPVKLVGVVRHPEGLRAALSVEREVLLVPAGHSAEGYTVVSIGDDGTVQIRTPQGEEMTLQPPR